MFCFSTTFCFICLKYDSKHKLLNIHKNEIDKIKITEILKYCAIDKDYCDDTTQVYVCTLCTKKLKSVFQFKRTCDKNFTKLKGYVSQLKTNINMAPQSNLGVYITDADCKPTSSNITIPSFERKVQVKVPNITARKKPSKNKDASPNIGTKLMLKDKILPKVRIPLRDSIKECKKTPKNNGISPTKTKIWVKDEEILPEVRVLLKDNITECKGTSENNGISPTKSKFTVKNEILPEVRVLLKDNIIECKRTSENNGISPTKTKIATTDEICPILGGLLTDKNTDCKHNGISSSVTTKLTSKDEILLELRVLLTENITDCKRTGISPTESKITAKDEILPKLRVLLTDNITDYINNNGKITLKDEILLELRVVLTDNITDCKRSSENNGISPLKSKITVKNEILPKLRVVLTDYITGFKRTSENNSISPTKRKITPKDEILPEVRIVLTDIVKAKDSFDDFIDMSQFIETQIDMDDEDVSNRVKMPSASLISNNMNQNGNENAVVVIDDDDDEDISYAGMPDYNQFLNTSIDDNEFMPNNVDNTPQHFYKLSEILNNETLGNDSAYQENMEIMYQGHNIDVSDDINETFVTNYECSRCKKSFASQAVLHQHKFLHSLLKFSNNKSKKQFTHFCELCRKTIVRTQNIKKHILWHTSEKLQRCDLCGLEYINLLELKNHFGQCTTLKQTDCHICQKRYFTEQKLQDHMMKKHRFSCTLCFEKFASKRLLKAHNLIKHHTQLCNFCLVTFPTNDALKIHLLNTHFDLHTMKGDVPCYCCSRCLREFHTKYSLNEHLITCKFLCNICNHSFETLANLKTHLLLIHLLLENDSQTTPVCVYCKQTFDRKDKLKQHLVNDHLHLINKKNAILNMYQKCSTDGFLNKDPPTAVSSVYKCNFCKVSYLNAEVLALHLYNYCCNKFPYKCEECLSTFSSAIILNDHLPVHDNNVECSLCRKVFASQLALNNHLKNHSGQDLQKMFSVEVID